MSGRIERVLAALAEAEVEYLIVGGVAVVMHGHLRTTADLDLVVRLESENALRTIRALTQLGLRPRAPVPAEAFADSDQREAWVETKNMLVFSMWDPTDPTFDVDLFIREPFDFDRAHARRLDVPVGATTARLVALDDLIELKRTAGRTQDLADVEALLILQQEGS